MKLQIKHCPFPDNELLFVVECDGKQSQPVALTSPYELQIEKYNTNLQQDLQWYLEKYIELPIEAYRTHAKDIQITLSQWGRNCFDTLFVNSSARELYNKAQQEDLTKLHIIIISKDPEVLSWPWEALKNQDNEFLSQHCRITRQIELDKIGNIQPLLDTLPQDKLNILYIIARPIDLDYIEYQTIARTFIDFITTEEGLPAHIDVLRPPTFEKLQQILEEKPNYYHIIHFDGHGKFNSESGGLLAFEGHDYSSNLVKATKLGKLLREYNVPLVVLSACQSAMQSKNAKDPFASVATKLLQEGICSVVAMSYILWVSGAKVFVPAFYQQLFKEGNIDKAMLVARQAMYNNNLRDAFTGSVELYDWIVPVLYQQTLENNMPKLQPILKCENDLSVSAQFLGDYCFIGRDQAIQQLERIICLESAGILIHGMAGEGKTTLIKGFLQWLKATNGLTTEVFWFNFQNIHSAEHIINKLSDSLIGTQESALSIEEKLSHVTIALKNKPFFIVWDNFESASGIPNTEVSALISEVDRNLLKQLLHDLRGGKTKVLITSRSPENWLTSEECQRLPLNGLQGQELWQYCNAVVKNLDITFDRQSGTYKKLMNKLEGNPLAIRAILLRLKEKSAEELLTELEADFNGLDGDDATRRIQAALLVFERELDQAFTPILRFLGLYEHCVDVYCLEYMLETAKQSNALINECFITLENAGLCHNIGNNRYQLHPALQSCLSRTRPAQETDKQTFVIVMSKLSDVFSTQELYAQWQVFTLFGANFYGALKLAQKINHQESVLILTENLALWALNIRNFVEAEKLYRQYLEVAKKAGSVQAEASAYHQLGWVAEERRDFSAAKQWYNESLQLSQRLGDKQGEANTCHNLGVVAWEQRDFSVAIEWYNKSLAIKQVLDDKRGMAQTYHNLGVVAWEQRDFSAAKQGYNESLQINKVLGDKHCVAQTYHNLGLVAGEQRDFTTAMKQYKKSLSIKQKLGDEYGVAQTCHQLGLVAQERRKFAVAKKWYNKSLQSSIRLGDEQGKANTYHQLGRVAWEQCDFATAENWYIKSLQISQDLGDALGVAKTCHNLGLVEFEQRNLIAAEEWYNKALKISQDLGDEHGVAQIYHNLGMIAQEQRDFSVAEEWYIKSLQIERKVDNEYGVAQTCHNLGIIAFERGDFTVAVEWFNESLIIKRKLGDEQGKAQTYYQLGLVAQKQRDFTVAIQQYNQAINFSYMASDESGVAQIYHQLGLVAQEQRDFTIAIEWCYKSLKLNQDLGDRHGVAQTYHQLGLVAQEQNDLDTAEEWYNKSLSICRKLGDEHGAAQTYHNLGLIAWAQRDFTTAKKRYNKALTIYLKMGDEHGVAQIYHNLGTVAREQSDFITAEKWYTESLQINQKVGNEQGVSITYHGLGNVAYERGDFDAAENWYNQSLQISLRLDDEQGVAHTCHNLGRIAQAQQDFVKAKEWYNKSLQINQKLADEYGVILTYQQLGQVAEAQRDFTVAIAWYTKALKINQKLDDEHGIAKTYQSLGNVTYEQRDFTATEKWYNKAIQLFEQLGDKHNSEIVKQSLTKLRNC